MISPGLAVVLQYSHLKLLITLSLTASLLLALIFFHRYFRKQRQVLSTAGGLTVTLLVWGFLCCLRLVERAALWQLDHRFGLYTGSLRENLHHFLAALFPELVILILLTGLFIHRRRLRRSFGLVLGLSSALLIGSLILFQPILSKPFRNTTRPVAAGELKEDLTELAQRAALPLPEIFIQAESRKSNRSNAQISGSGSTLRLTLYDNLLKRFSRREVRAIVAHEYAHLALGHITLAVVTASLLLIFGWLLTEVMFQVEIERRGPPFHHILEASDISAILLILLLLFYLVRPLALGVSRLAETEADHYAIQLIQDNDAFSSAMIRLHQENFIPPGRGMLYHFFFSSHPTLEQRLDNLEIQERRQVKEAELIRDNHR